MKSKESKRIIMTLVKEDKVQSKAKGAVDIWVSINPHILQVEDEDFKGGGEGSFVFCFIFILLVLEMTLLLAIILWRFFDLDFIDGDFGQKSNLEIFNITDHNDYSHHHYRHEN